MNGEDFQQTVLDYFDIATQRHRDIMGVLADVKAGSDAIRAELSKLNQEAHEALSVFKDTGQAGYSAVMDEIIADQEIVLSLVKQTNESLKTAIAAVPVPSPTPATP